MGSDSKGMHYTGQPSYRYIEDYSYCYSCTYRRTS
jgi:hypothetical protein